MLNSELRCPFSGMKCSKECAALEEVKVNDHFFHLRCAFIPRHDGAYLDPSFIKASREYAEHE